MQLIAQAMDDGVIMRNAREKTVIVVGGGSEAEGMIPPINPRGRGRLSQLRQRTKMPELEEGSVYAERWAAGARSLDEVAPSMAAWVRWRGLRRGLLTLLILCLAVGLTALAMPAP